MKPSPSDYERLRYTMEAVTDLSVHAVEVREISSAAHSILYLLLGSVAIPRGLLLGCDAGGRLYPLAAKPGRPGTNGKRVELGGGRPEFAALMDLNQVVETRDRRLPASLRSFLHEREYEYALPLVVRRRLAGVLAFGRRVTGDPLAPHEREVLETLARYAAVLLHQQDLVQQLRGAVDENLRLCETLADTYFETVKAFSAAIDAKDVYTKGHSLRVARYSAGLATRIDMPRKTIAGIRIGAYLHDIGKLVLDRSLLNKPSRLSDDERREMIAHPLVGFEVLSSVRFPWPEVRDVVRSHHERLDGAGYPDGLRGMDIPLPARVLSVADAFDAMTSSRPYRERLSVGSALEELVACSRQQFDPTLVRAFLEQCQEEVAYAETLAAREKKSAGVKKPRQRVLGTLVQDVGRSVTSAMVGRLIKLLGPVPRLQTA